MASDRIISIGIWLLPSLAMDTFFLSHGSPMMAIDESIPARHFLEPWRSTVMPGVEPKAILMVSAHWDTSEPSVTTGDGPYGTIHARFRWINMQAHLKYPAPGAPHLANRVKELLHQAGIPTVREDKARGLDHGAWVPLMLMYPEGNIPVCQLSVQSQRDGTFHYNMGKALAPLREEGILIIGSGSATHNLIALGPDGGPIPSWALDFDTWLKESLVN